MIGGQFFRGISLQLELEIEGRKLILDNRGQGFSI